MLAIKDTIIETLERKEVSFRRIGRRRIYVASSWRNELYPSVVDSLRKIGHDVFDFRNKKNNFIWSDIDHKWKEWDLNQQIEALNHINSEAGFESDFNAMKWADTFVLVNPCGRSAHLELGWATGCGKETIILLNNEIDNNRISNNKCEPELMYKLADHIVVGLDGLIEKFKEIDRWS